MSRSSCHVAKRVVNAIMFSVLLAAQYEILSQRAIVATVRQGEPNERSLAGEPFNLANGSASRLLPTLPSQEQEQSTREQVIEFIKQGEQARTEGDFQRALIAFGRAKDIAEQIGAQAELADALGKLGNLLRLQGKYSEALPHLQKSIALSEASADKKRLAQALNTAGIIYQAQGEMGPALDYYKKSLALSQAVNDKTEIARSLNNLGAYYRTQSDLAQALSFYQKALQINEELGNPTTIAMLLSNIGNVYMAQGSFSESFEFFKRSLDIRQASKDERGIAHLLTLLGINYRALGDEEQAFQHFQKSLALQERHNNRDGMAFALEYMGISLLNWKDDKAGATGYFQRSLEIYRSLGSKLGAARLLIWLGRVHYTQGDYARTLEFYEEGLKTYEATGEKSGHADVLINISNAYRSHGDPQKALEYARRATALARQISVQRFVADARIAEGKAYQALDRNEQAAEAYAEAIAAVEYSRARISGQTTRAAYFTTVREPYELYVDLLMKMHKERPTAGHDHLAFQMSERARARSLLESLAEARVNIRRGVSPTLLGRERVMRQQLNGAAERQTLLLSGTHTPEQAALLKKEIDELAEAYELVQGEIRRKSPLYAALTQPQPLTIKEIQQNVLDQATVLLHYALGEERSYVWVVSSNSVSSFELPKRKVIEQETGRVRELLVDGNSWATSNTIAAQYEKAATALSQMLLPTGLLAKVRSRRLAVSADGVLQYLPFGALLVTESGTGGESRPIAKPLIVDHEIVSLPSASSLYLLRQDTANRIRAGKTVAVLADPVFEAKDERVVGLAGKKSSRSGDTDVNTAPGTTQYDGVAGKLSAPLIVSTPTSQANLSRELGRAAGAAGALRDGQQSLGRLPFSRREAEMILKLVPAGAGLKVLDFEASRETATSAELGGYRFVHFATHGLLNSERPELSGIVLSLVDRNGQPADGFLRLNEIYNLELPVELVVLSACQTGLGREIRGEGLIGLVRGFMYAGAPRVVASLWKVDDRATAELMKRFYTAMLSKQNMSPSAALRQAKNEMLKEDRWRAPFYWAAFELQGEWK